MGNILNITSNQNISISDIISVLTFFSIIIGGVFALRKWNMNLKIKRAEYVKSLINEMRTNQDIVLYLFDYNTEIWYNENFHNNLAIERKIDYTLNFFSYICYLSKHKIIKTAEYNCFKYNIERILKNNQFQFYCYNLYHFSARIKQPMPFYDLFTYAKNNHYFDDDFWNNRSQKYPRYLNF